MDSVELRPPVARASAICPVEVAIAVVGGAWKMTAVKHLHQRPFRFGELQRAIGTVTPRVLTRQLRELEADGIVHRQVFAEVPPRVEYSLTRLGESLGDLVEQLDAWGQRYLVHSHLSGRETPSNAVLAEPVHHSSSSTS